MVLGVGCEPGTCVFAVFVYALFQGVHTVVGQLVVQFMQQFNPNNFTVAPLGTKTYWPIKAMGFQQDTPAINIVGVYRRSDTQIGNALQWGFK